MQPTFGDSPGR